jgi:hypothetical protein
MPPIPARHVEESGEGSKRGWCAVGRWLWHTVIGRQPEDGGAESRVGEAGEEREIRE